MKGTNEIYADFFVAELSTARKYPCEVDFEEADKAAFISVTPVDLARLFAVIADNPDQLFGLAKLMELAEDDNRHGEVLTPLPPWFLEVVGGLSAAKVVYYASRWSKVDDISLDVAACNDVLGAIRRLACRARFGKRLFLWNSTLSAKFLRKREPLDEPKTGDESRAEGRPLSLPIHRLSLVTDPFEQPRDTVTGAQSDNLSLEATPPVRADAEKQSQPNPVRPETPLATLLSIRRNPMNEPLTEAELIALVKQHRLGTTSVQSFDNPAQERPATKAAARKPERNQGGPKHIFRKTFMMLWLLFAVPSFLSNSSIAAGAIIATIYAFICSLPVAAFIEWSKRPRR